MTAVYAVLSWALWMGRRWALPLGFVLTLPQLFTISSWLVSWRFYVGISIDLGGKPVLDILHMPLSIFWHVGSSYFAACFGYNALFAADVAPGPLTTYLSVNLVAVLVLFLLIRLWHDMRYRTPRRTNTGVPTPLKRHA